MRYLSELWNTRRIYNGMICFWKMIGRWCRRGKTQYYRQIVHVIEAEKECPRRGGNVGGLFKTIMIGYKKVSVKTNITP